jgi:hypothetical protein
MRLSRTFGVMMSAGLLLTGVQLAPAAPAAAAVPGLVRAQGESAQTDSTDQKTAEVTCPDDKVVVGTGYDLIGANGAVVVDVLRPDGSLVKAPRSVFLHASEVDPYAGDWRVRVYATCAALSLSHVRQALAATGSQQGDSAQITAFCPDDMTMTGTAFEVNRFGSVVVNQLAPSGSITLAPDAVLARAHVADEFPGRWILTAYAICTDQLPDLVLATQVGFLTPNDAQDAAVSCLDNKVITGGGFELPLTSGEAVADDFRTNGGAQAPTILSVKAFEEDPFDGDWLVIAYAICASR